MHLSKTVTMLSNDLPRLIKNRRITHETIASVLNVHPSTIARWMNNDFSNSDLQYFIKLISYLETIGVIDYDYFEILNDRDTDCSETTGTIE